MYGIIIDKEVHPTRSSFAESFNVGWQRQLDQQRRQSRVSVASFSGRRELGSDSKSLCPAQTNLANLV
jgi:hypothetical protein